MAINTNHRVQEKSPSRDEATTGVIPPASKAVEPNRFREPMAIITDLLKGDSRGICQWAITCS